MLEDLSHMDVSYQERSADGGFEPFTLIDLLRWRALHQADATAYTFLADGEREEASLSYAELDCQARAIGAHLRSLGAGGERVLLVYPSGLEYIAAFFGCLYAGALAVPVYPPRKNRMRARFQAIVADAKPVAALTSSQLLSTSRWIFENSDSDRVRRIVSDAIPLTDAERWVHPPVTGDTLAFLQYTSGSTATPKGVMVSHSNLIHNQRIIKAACHHTEASTFVGWLPLYHDMGLIGNILQPLYLGSRCVLKPPAAYKQKTLRRLQSI